MAEVTEEAGAAQPPQAMEAGAPPAPEAAAEASSPQVPLAGDATETVAEVLEKKAVGVRDLLEAGCHFGHKASRWNPSMKPFLFGERNGVHIIDLDQTLPRFKEALEFLRETVAEGGKVLFVATKRQAQSVVEMEAKRSGQYYVNRRWLGGMLTNFKTVKKSIDRYKEMLGVVADEERVAEFSKKELSRINRSIDKYSKSLDGLKEMTKLPEAVFVLDVNREAIAVQEARRLGIPVIAVVDSNCDPNAVDHVIPGNDDSMRAIQLYFGRVADACAEGGALRNERLQSKAAEEEQARAEEAEKPSTGRVVVEIKQQPRRGRSTHSAGPRAGAPGRSGAPGKPAGEAPPPAAAEAPDTAAAEAPDTAAAEAPDTAAAEAPDAAATEAPETAADDASGAAPAEAAPAEPAPPASE